MNKKDTFYFSHDYNARNDEKIIDLIMVHGMQGYGIYWSIVENLYNNANALQTHYKRIAFELRVDEDIVKSVINDFNLFIIEGDFFYSSSVAERLEKRVEISENARNAANKRWAKNADAMPMQCDSNADVMQRKGKEIKEKKENTIDISLTTLSLVEKIFLDKTAYNWTESYAKKEAEKFYNFYASKGWKVGKEKMKSLPHAIGGWISRNEKPETVNAPKEETEREYRLRMFNERNGLNER
jgi:hypothetical protein